MQNNNYWMCQTLQQIAELGDLETDTEKLSLVTTENDFLQKLEEIVAYLIERDFEKLLWILYRIDVDEQRTKRILSQNVPADAPKVLAQLILERQKQKEEFRKSFHQAAVSKEDEDLLL
jgi:hypothetical protein